MTEQASIPRLSMVTKAGWGLADAGINIFVYIKSVIILAFMTQYMGVGVGLAGGVTGLVVLTDMVTDPLIGALSDRSATRFGRRRPFMVVGMVLMFAFTYLMFTPPNLTGAAAAAWVFVFYALASVGFTLVAVPYGAMATEMTPSRTERITLTGFRMAFAAIGLLLAGLLVKPPAIAAGSATTWLTVAALMMVPVTICVLATARAPRINRGSVLPFAEQLALVRANPSFLRHVAAYGVMTLGVAILSGGILFITTDISIRQAQGEAYASYFAEDFSFATGQTAAAGNSALDRDLMARLGVQPPEEGWIDRRGRPVDPAQVQRIDPRVPDWFAQIDFEALQASPYGRIQADAVQTVLNRAIQTRIVGPARFLVALAGFFAAVFALFLLGSILSQLVWVPLAHALGRGRTLVIALLAYGTLACLYLLVLRGGNPSLIVYGALALGFCNGAYQNLPWAILPSMIDEANARSKVNVEGIFNGVWLSGQKIANSLGPMVFGTLVAWYGFQESTLGLRPQTPQASAALEVFMTVLPGVCLLAAIPLFLTVRQDLRT